MHHVAMRSRPPAVVDEVTVRLVAGVVLLAVLLMIASQQWWVFLLLAVDLTLRAALGPQASPVARAVNRWVRPRVPALPHPTAGTPKRFAAAIGAVLTSAASVLWLVDLAVGAAWPGTVVVVIAVVMAVFPAQEALLGVCVGCVLFGWLMRAGLVPEDVCLECADITSRLRASSAAG